MPCALEVENGRLTAVGRPNDALGPRGRLWITGLLVLATLLVGLAWTWLGAWMVLPFAGLEAAVLFGAWWWVARHSRDFEQVVIDPDEVTVRLRRGRDLETHAFKTIWTRVVKEEAAGGGCRVRLCSSGRAVEVGVWLPADQRRGFADALAEHLRRSGAVGGKP